MEEEDWAAKAQTVFYVSGQTILPGVVMDSLNTMYGFVESIEFYLQCTMGLNTYIFLKKVIQEDPRVEYGIWQSNLFMFSNLLQWDWG